MNNLDAWIKQWVNILDTDGVCPYAKKTLEADKVKIRKVTDNTDLYKFWQAVSEECESWDDTKHIVIIAMNTNNDQITRQQLQGGTDSLNTHLNTQQKKLWLLNSHGDIYTMVFIQCIEKLDDASKIMESKGYYKNTHPYLFKKSILGRRKLRNKLSKVT